MEKTFKTKIHFYNFDLKKPEEKIAWENMRDDLKGLGLKIFTFNTEVNRCDWKKMVHENKTEDVYLDAKVIFDDQWNGSCDSLKNHRFFDWLLYDLPNKDARKGHWIEPTYETADSRCQFQCRYCGHINGYDKGDGFHHKCLGSEYMKIDELYMATYGRIYNKWAKNVSVKSIEIPEYIKEEHVKRQKEFWAKKSEQRYAEMVQKAKQNIIDAKLELKAVTFLNARGFTDFDNLIYYNHSHTFGFGWRKNYGEKAQEVRNFLENIGFHKFGKYEVK
jgi:hypothetical protein